MTSLGSLEGSIVDDGLPHDEPHDEPHDDEEDNGASSSSSDSESDSSSSSSSGSISIYSDGEVGEGEVPSEPEELPIVPAAPQPEPEPPAPPPAPAPAPPGPVADRFWKGFKFCRTYDDFRAPKGWEVTCYLRSHVESKKNMCRRTRNLGSGTDLDCQLRLKWWCTQVLNPLNNSRHKHVHETVEPDVFPSLEELEASPCRIEDGRIVG